MKRCSGTLENKYPEWGDAAVQTACSELSGAFASFFLGWQETESRELQV